MVGLNNFAAASDILRYEILRQFGGAYFDTDTTFVYPKFEFKLAPQQSCFGFMFNGFKTEYGRDHKKNVWEKGVIGNDIILSLPAHEILENILTSVLRKYTDEKRVQEKRKIINPEAETEFQPRRYHTLTMSGPDVLYSATSAYWGKLNEEDRNYDNVSNFACLSSPYNLFGINVSSHSAQTWLYTKNQKLRSFSTTNEQSQEKMTLTKAYFLKDHAKETKSEIFVTKHVDIENLPKNLLIIQNPDRVYEIIVNYLCQLHPSQCSFALFDMVGNEVLLHLFDLDPLLLTRLLKTYCKAEEINSYFTTHCDSIIKVILQAKTPQSLNYIMVYFTGAFNQNKQVDTLILLKPMLLQLRAQHGMERMTAVIFRHIMYKLLYSSPTLSDDSLINALQSSVANKYNDRIEDYTKLLEDLTKQWHLTVHEVLSSAKGLTPASSKTLSSTWQDLSRNFTLFKKIYPDFVSDVSYDKSMLYANVVKAALAYEGDRFDLQATLSNFFPVVEEQNLSLRNLEEIVSEHEQALVVILIISDKKIHWAGAIQLLESPPINRFNWIDYQYNGRTVIELALEQKNAPLIQYLLKEDKLNRAAVSHLLRTAIDAMQWDTVKHLIYLTGANKPDLESMSKALVAATKANQLAPLLTIESSALQKQGVFQNKRPKIELPVDVDALLALLVENGEKETIRQLSQLSPSQFTPTSTTSIHDIDFLKCTMN